MFKTELFHINDDFIASIVLVNSSVFIQAMKQDNSDVGARERDKRKLKQSNKIKRKLGFSEHLTTRR